MHVRVSQQNSGFNVLADCGIPECQIPTVDSTVYTTLLDQVCNVSDNLLVFRKQLLLVCSSGLGRDKTEQIVMFVVSLYCSRAATTDQFIENLRKS